MDKRPVLGKNAGKDASPVDRANERKLILRETIIDAALAEIDENGLDSFRIRNLANRLNVYPATIYWYMPSKEHILAEVVRRVLVDVANGAREAFWRDRLRELCLRYREAVRAHPNIAPLTGGTLLANAAAELDMVEAVLSIVRDAGLEGPLLVAGYNAIIAALVGFVSEEFATVSSNVAAPLRDAVEHRLSALREEDYPVLAANQASLINRAFILRWENGATRPLNESFSYFVDIIVLGLEGLAAVQRVRPPL